MKIAFRAVLASLLGLCLATGALADSHQEIIITHALTKFDEAPKYPADFKSYDWVNPDAPKAGTIRVARLGGFDNFNYWTDKGDIATGIREINEPLLTVSADEKETYYGLIAERFKYPKDRSWITFYLRPEARFSDGEPITADDVVFSLKAMKEMAAEVYAQSFDLVDRVEKVDDHTVTFYVKEGKENRDFPLVVGTLRILPQHWWKDRDFQATWLETPLGSGPYIMERYQTNRFVEWKLNPDYWGKDLAVNRGLNNFLTKRDEYYADSTTMRIGMKGGEFDYYPESRSKSWSVEWTEEEVPALGSGLLNKELLDENLPQPFQTMMFNYNNPHLKDWRVRRAINRTFNFEWTNKNIFFDAYDRTQSIFANATDLAAKGLPEGRTKEVLEDLKATYPDEFNPLILTQAWALPITDGTKNNRQSLALALKDFQDAGWTLARAGANKGKLVNAAGEQMKVEFLFYSSNFDSILQPMVEDLRRLGVDATQKRVDTTVWIDRLRDRKFDVTSISYPNSFYPGEEQRRRYHSEFHDKPLSWNLAGINSPMIDDLTTRITQAEDYEELAALSQTLDYVIKWEYIGLFEWHLDKTRLLSWDLFDRPAVQPAYATGIAAWWWNEEKAQRVKDAGFYK